MLIMSKNNSVRFLLTSLLVSLAVIGTAVFANGERSPVAEFHHTPSGYIRDVDFSPDGKTALTATHIVNIWDVETGNLTLSFEEHTHWVLVAKFSADGKRVASGDQNGNAIVWDVETGQIVWKFLVRVLDLDPDRYPDGVTSLALSPDGDQLLTERENQVVLWDLDKGTEIRRIKGYEVVSFFPDGQRVLLMKASSTGVVWDSTTGEILQTFRGCHPTLSQEGSQILTVVDGSVGGTRKVLTYDVQKSELVHSSAEFYALGRNKVFSPSGMRLLVGGVESLSLDTRLIDLSKTTDLATFLPGSDEAGVMSFSHDGSSILIANGDTAYLYDISDLASAVGETQEYGKSQ